MAKSVTCEKCGCEVIPPGRLTMFDGMVSRTWCDCITEQEMNDLAVQFEALWRMWTGSPKVMASVNDERVQKIKLSVGSTPPQSEFWQNDRRFRPSWAGSGRGRPMLASSRSFVSLLVRAALSSRRPTGCSWTLL